MKEQKDKYDDQLEEQRRLKQEEQGFKAMFKHKVVGPLTIGVCIALVGVLFETEPLIWIGIGIHGFGWYLAVKDG